MCLCRKLGLNTILMISNNTVTLFGRGVVSFTSPANRFNARQAVAKFFQLPHIGTEFKKP
jgi:hypothetical protein